MDLTEMKASAGEGCVGCDEEKLPSWDCDVSGATGNKLALSFSSWNLLEGGWSVPGLRELGNGRPQWRVTVDSG